MDPNDNRPRTLLQVPGAEGLLQTIPNPFWIPFLVKAKHEFEGMAYVGCLLAS